MAVGALRAAGIAAAALGYHVWRLLTKQDTSTLEELQESEEVLRETPQLLLLGQVPPFPEVMTVLLANRKLFCRA